ncbi:MAG: nitroreductase family protein [Candidatus Thiodiazotropha sp. (ex Lucinoma kastoroae)]|nr:nitroreductase family protein [Candidatus Thiodiazotropha sp. (ex Lucinoma kastoroae)]
MLKAILTVLWRLYNIILIHINDCVRYIRYSQCIFNKSNKAALESVIMRRCHGLERGLSFTARKRNFGKPKILELIGYLERYIELYSGLASPAVEYSVIALRGYVDTKATDDLHIIDRIETLLGHETMIPYVRFGEPTHTLYSTEIMSAARSNFDELCKSRHSIREYSSDPVDTEDIEKAIRMAQRSPSACNKQSVRCYYTSDKRKIELLNKFPLGNRGFQNPGAIVFVSTSFNSHDLAEERHQGYTEAGMFAMTLVYAFHYLGMGTCVLSAAVKPKIEKDIVKEFGIQEDEALCIMISIGHLPDEVSVAKSGRFSFDTLYRNLDL